MCSSDEEEMQRRQIETLLSKIWLIKLLILNGASLTRISIDILYKKALENYIITHKTKKLSPAHLIFIGAILGTFKVPDRLGSPNEQGSHILTNSLQFISHA